MSDRIDMTGYPPPASFGCPSCAALRAEVAAMREHDCHAEELQAEVEELRRWKGAHKGQQGQIVDLEAEVDEAAKWKAEAGRLAAEVERLDRRVREYDADRCENGHHRHEDCTDACECVGQGKSRIEQAENQRDALLKALREIRSTTSCEHYHHDKRDRHEYDAECPVEARFDATIAAAAIKEAGGVSGGSPLRPCEVCVTLRAENARLRALLERAVPVIGVEPWTAKDTREDEVLQDEIAAAIKEASHE